MARLLFTLLFLASAALAQPLTAHQQFTKDIYQELVEIRTVHPDGDNTAAARAVEKHLLAAGFDPRDVEVLEPAPKKGNVVARLRGTGELRPLLLLAHLDVVEALKADWSDGLDPFKLTEKDGFFYGRGTMDDKAMAAIFTANLARARREGWKPKRDIILALTADEEGGGHNGVAWLLGNRRELIDAEFALNEGGILEFRDGRPAMQRVQVSEKVPLTFDFVATNRGGHSSLPRRDNAIYELAFALDRLSRHEFPVRMNYVVRMLAAKSVEIEKGERAQALAALAAGTASPGQIALVSTDPSYNAQLRTTCVATRLEAGHAVNALPQTARATVNCRLLPGESPDYVHAELARVAGEAVTVTPMHKARSSEASDAESPVMKTIARVSETMWPGVPVLPAMSAGATDGSRLRNAGIPVYGVNGLAMDGSRMHGRDERLAASAFFAASDFLDRLVRALAAGD